MDDVSEQDNEPTQTEKTHNHIQQLYPALLLGDSTAWGKFYDYFNGRIDFFFRKEGVNNSRDREDLFHQVMVTIFDALRRNKYNPEKAPLVPWVYGVVKNVLRRHKKQNIEFVTTEDTGDRALNRATLKVGNPFEQDETVSGDPRLRRLKLALDSLKEKDRQILQLRASRIETSWDELAQELKINTSTAKMRHQRAIPKLADAYNKLASDP